MRITYERGIIRLITFAAALSIGWMLKGYYITSTILLTVIIAYAAYYILSGFIELD
ncbi:MAG: hypothetical protein KAS75_01760 [Planctomycetes bacterium]|nr:hypothetical protein [Planctomycetota bacterium]